MPRKKKPPSEDVHKSIHKINSYLEKNNITLNQLSTLSGVPQPSLWKFVSGARKSVTKAAIKALVYIEKKNNKNNSGRGTLSHDVDLASVAPLKAALRGHSDLSEPTIDVLVKVILALAPLLESGRHTDPQPQ